MIDRLRPGPALLLVAGLALSVGCHAFGAAPKLVVDGGAIHHTVFFTLKHPPDSAEEREFLARLEALSSIPALDAFQIVREVSDRNPYRHGLVTRFADRAAYERYDRHPDHVRFVQEVWISQVEIFQEIDFVGAPAP